MYFLFLASLSILVGFDSNGNFQHFVKKLQRRENHVVDVLDVIKTEKLLESGKLLGQNVIFVLQNPVSDLLRFLFGFQCLIFQKDIQSQ